MRKSILLFLIFQLISLSVFGEKPDKQYKKLIEKFDVADEAKIVSQNSPVEFWEAVLVNNTLLGKFIKDIQKNMGAEKEALNKTANLPKFYLQYDESIVEACRDSVILY